MLTRGDDAPPEQIQGGAALCISCGHCVAACPFGACALDTMPAGDCPPLRPEWRLSPEQAEHFLRSRRSVRVFKGEAVAHGRLERLIRTARYAPSGRNNQPVRWLVISGREPVHAIAGHVIDWMRAICVAKPEAGRALMLDRLVAAWDAGRDLICRAAPHLIVAHAPKDDVTAPERLHAGARLPRAGGAVARSRRLLGRVSAHGGAALAAAAGGAGASRG